MFISVEILKKVILKKASNKTQNDYDWKTLIATEKQDHIKKNYSQ